MFIDTSVIVVILSREPDAAAYADRSEAAKVRLMRLLVHRVGLTGAEDRKARLFQDSHPRA